MATTGVSERLKELAAFLEHQHAVESIEETVGHLKIEMEDAMGRSRASAQQCTILLFQSVEPPSLLKFLSDSANLDVDSRKREISVARVSVLSLLVSFLKTYGAHCALSKQHVVDMYKTCQVTARADPFNRVKAHALKVVINVLKYADKNVDSEDMKPRDYVEKLFYDIKFSKATQTAKEQMLLVIGYLVEKFSKEVESSVPSLLIWTEDALEKQFLSNSPEMMTVNGLLFALTRLLECDPGRYTRNDSQRKKIYSYLLTVFATTVGGNLSRYQVTNSSATFLAKHARVFQQEIGPSGYIWFSYMKFCCLSDNKTIKKSAFSCSSAIFEALNAFLVDTIDDMRKKCLNKILKEVLPVVSNSAADTSTMAFAVQCLGCLAQSIHCYLGAKSYGKIEEKLRTFGESLLALDAKATAWKWPLFFQYVQSIGHFVKERHDVRLDDGYVKFLGDVLCHLMTAYPQCLWKSKLMVHKSVAALLFALSRWTVVDPLVDRFVLHTLMLSISNATDPDQPVIYHPDTGELVTNLLYDYEGFWLALLCCHTESLVEPTPVLIATRSDDVEMKKPTHAGRALQVILVDSTIKHVLAIIDQLDLSYKFDLQQKANYGKITAGYIPAVPRDHSIMLNLTEFFERVVGKISRPLLLPWVSLIMHEIFTIATKLPLVSCFYRIGAVVVMNVDGLKYFDTVASCDGSDDGRQSRFRDDLANFVRRVCDQTRYYQDELLVTCAEFVLMSPIGLIALDTMIDIVKSILELGRSYLPAATVAVKTLERWQMQCPMKLEDVMSEVVSQLSTYLDQEEFSDSELLLMKTIRRGALRTDIDESSELAQLQRRILLLLGKCGGKVSLLMSEPPAVVNDSNSMGCIPSPFFQLKLQLSDVSLSLALDPILSHLGDLAAHSSVRRVKVISSEGYHALICYLCGTTTTHPHAAGKKTVFYDMWCRVFTRVVRLATDSEKICRSLFEPLLFQLLRWLAINFDTFPFEYASMLDELIRCLSDSDSAVRTMSARCIATLLFLAIEDAKARIEVDDLFERIFSLCRHPGAIQRSGAVATISYFLQSLSEENGAVLTEFALPCLKNLLCALRLCDNNFLNTNGGVDISQDVISKAVMKIERGIFRFSHLFLKESTAARHDSAMTSDTIFQQTTIWLFQQTGAREILFRRLCRQLFMSFSALICESSIEWMEKYASSHGRESITAVLMPMSLLARTLPDVTIEWMEQLSASIESCIWCIELLGDKAEDFFALRLQDPRQESMKRKHSPNPTDRQGQSCLLTLSRAITTLLRHEGPWEKQFKRSHWIGSYLSVMVSLCSYMKLLMKNNCNTMFLEVADVDNQAFQAGIVKKLLLTLLHRPDSWANDASAFDKIKEFCTRAVLHSQDWARQVQKTVEDILSTLALCFTNMNSSEDFLKHLSKIESLVFFGSEVLSAGITNFPKEDKFAAMLAMVASKSIKYGHGSAESRLVAVAALKAAAACGWKIIDIFANSGDRQLYGPVLSDVIQFIPTLTVWNRCASELVSLSLKNGFVANILADVLLQVAACKVYSTQSTEWDAFAKILVVNMKQLVKMLDVTKVDTQQTLSMLHILRYFLELCKHCSEDLLVAARIGPISDIQRAIIDLLKHRGCSSLVKAEILRILASLGPTSSLVSCEQHASNTLDALVAFIYDEFPIVSTDVSRGSKEFDVFRLLFSELLSVIEQSKSIAYLKIIYPSLKEGSKHLFGAEIKLMLARFSSSLGSSVHVGRTTNQEVVQNQLVELLDVLLDPTLDVAIRKSLLEWVFTPLTECQSGDILQHFYTMKSTTKKTSIICLLAALISTSAEATSEGSRIGVFVAYSLVEVLYRLIDPEIIRTDINSAFLGHKNGKGRELTMLVCKCASKVVTKAYEDVDDLTRMTCCAAYNCLLVAVSRTQKQEKFYDQILFQPALWSNILDLSRDYDLPAETEEFATIPLTSLSAITLQARLDTNSTTNPRRNTSAALQFFTSSSLSVDLDTFTASAITAPLDIEQAGDIYPTVEIELDALNQHPCMISLLRVLVQMKADFGSGWDDKTMPGWMRKLFDVVVDQSVGLNVRLFLAKVVLDIPEVFVMYGSSWLGAVMEALLDVNAAQKVSELNYVLRDCCNLVLNSWNGVVPSAVMDIPSRFINELIKLCPVQNNMIRDSNVLLVTQLIALWKDSVHIDMSLLINYINADDEDTRIKTAKHFTALQSLSAMVNVGLVHNLTSRDDERHRIEDGILLVMTSKATVLYTLAAEAGGLYLQYIDDTLGEDFMSKLKNLIISSYDGEDYGRFLALLRNASMHHPETIDSIMLHRLSFVLPKAASVDAWALLAADTLINAAANAYVAKEVFAHVQPTLGRLLGHRHAAVQHSTLRAISRLLDCLTLPELERLVANGAEGGLSLFKCYEDHEFSACRGLLFTVAKKLYDKNLSEHIKARVRAFLLCGLCDPDDQCRHEAFEHWNTSEAMATSCSDRLLAIFGSLYSQQFDEKWVLYATNLLVGMSKKSNDFKRPLFPAALGSGEYAETFIDSTWNAKSLSMAPLFSVEAEKLSACPESIQSSSVGETLSSQTVGTIQSQLFLSKSASVGIAPCNNRAFEELDTVRHHAGRTRFSKRHMTVDNAPERSALTHDKKVSQRFFQDHYAMLKKKQEAHVIRERRQRQGQVSLTRTYRVGEFPDIQITQRDLVDPIMALCEFHAETSSLMFGAMFSTIVTSPEFEKSGNSSELADRLERTLTLSKASSVYVSCVVSAYLAGIVSRPRLCKMLPISPIVIGEAGLSSEKYYLGELVLEEQLIYSIQCNDMNLNRGFHESMAASWDLLYKVLRTVHKNNFLTALLMTCTTANEYKLALEAQLSGDLSLAIASYKKAESVLESQMEFDDSSNSSHVPENSVMRCRWQRLHCLETLNSWEALKDEMFDAVEKDSEFIWKQRSPYLEQAVGHYMRCCLGLSQATRTDQIDTLTSLQNFIEGAKHYSTRRELIQSKFPVEVCLAYLSMGNTNEVRVCVETFYSNFLKLWKQTSPVSSSSRLGLIQSLSSIVEIDELLLRFGDDRQNSFKQEQHNLTGFIGAWQKVPPTTGEDGMLYWSQHTMVQDSIAGFLLDSGRSQDTLSDDMRLTVLTTKSKALLQYANAAISCNILALASKLLKRYREHCNAYQLPKLSVEMVEMFVLHVLKLVDRQEHSRGLNSSSLKLITRYYDTATNMFDNVEVKNMMEIASSNDQVAMRYLEAKTFASAAAFYAFNDVDEHLTKEYFQRSLDMFKVSCQQIDGISRYTLEDGAPAAFLRCRLTFIEFLNDLLFKQKMETLAKLAERKALTKLLAENVLGGMATGDRECAHYFPEMCDLIAPYPDVVGEFEKYVLTNVPLWTCLQWSAQLMALLSGPIGKTILSILEKMAEQYPVALFYDFMVTCKSSLDRFKIDLHRLEVLLANTMMEKFVTALRLIHHPELRLKEGLREIAKLFEQNRTPDAHHKVKLLWNDCFSPDRPLLGDRIGRYNRNWSRNAKRDVEKIMGKDGSKMTAKTVASAREWINSHFGVIPGRFGITKDMKAHLGDFAEWLEEFDHSSCYLELPGQYTAHWGPPNPSTHIRILSFDSMLGVLSSKQLPKRLVLHCSDEKDYTFLVKGGEDLRLDQRIEQLFGVMNQILDTDPRCHNQRLSLRTYGVIPMTQEIGIVEWVSGTSTLKGVIETQLQIDERCTNLKINKRQKLELFNTTAAKAYESFLLEQRGASFSAKVVAPRSKDVVDQFAKVQAMIPADLLRRQLLGLGTSFEAFLLVRDNFLKSLSVFSACSYILGIGDRHLDNFLFDLASGHIIGIDFGVSFGAGASVLPVPELIPFRYTRQMEFVFQPYDGTNLLSQEMQVVFEALRAKRQVIESVMNVFLHEPLLDWQQSTTTHQKTLFETVEGDDRSTIEDSSDVDMEEAKEPDCGRVSRSAKRMVASQAEGKIATVWLPDIKIAIARKKLEGVSPALLLKEELSQNSYLTQQISRFHALIDAASVSQDSENEMITMSSLSQAQELLTLATSPDLLGRTFQGWMPWL
ncbi:unnamed protein product [Peronospora belbahrii]|uniref:Non-specific serine/threonine protein kinase n=1 Tax=Peronospora belbahrii TaxID=622444 RepID=A0AAU9KV36_9STRA|nr:unnamed protein product [Peronospora belbahrii]